MKNKAPAPIQITAEQLLQEAHERLEGDEFNRKKAFIGREQSAEFKQRTRSQFEDQIRRNRTAVGAYLKYARFEEVQEEWTRARSVYERAIDVEPRNQVIWLKYAELEMRLKNVNLARNVWNRAVTILPRVDQFWYKFAYMEEMLGNLEASREIFERWMKWEPEEAIWLSYIKFETRYRQWDNCRRIYARLLAVHPSINNWIKWAEFEGSRGGIEESRAIYERALDVLADSPTLEPRLFICFARFEVKQREFDRARAIFKLGMEQFPPHLAPALQHSYVQFEREWGDSVGITQSVVLQKRRLHYSTLAESEPYNYDNWFDWIRLEEEALLVDYSSEALEVDSTADLSSIREVFERAIAQVPVIEEKRHWRRYIYLWLFYATFEEFVAKDRGRALAVLQTALRLIPHQQFTFTKLWTHLANFHLRGGDVAGARKAFGQAIGLSSANGSKSPKSSIFTRYIQMELDLREFDRSRALYERHLSLDPGKAVTWVKFAELERLLLDDERARMILQLACDQPLLDVPELAWKAAIDFEFENGDHDKMRELYEQLLERAGFHLKIWVSFANMELLCANDNLIEGLQRARVILQRAYDHFKTHNANTERLVLLEAWKEIEAEHGSEADVVAINAKFPRRIKKRRRVLEEDAWEEFYDYIFPDDEAEVSKAKGHLKLLQLAHQWKQQSQ